MNELVEWLRTQLDEDAARAQRMIDAVWPQVVHVMPTADTGDAPQGSVSAAPGVPKRYQRMWDGGAFEHGWVVHESAVEVWSRQLGEQSLREVAAKRAIVDLLEDPIEADQAARLLASAYADRPGYREEWRP